MASIKYDEIYSCFLGKITDYKFASLPADDAYDLMKDWLRSSIAQPYIRRIFSSITLNDDIMMAEFEIVDSVDESADRDYGIEIIARAMAIEWLEPQVKTTTSIAQMFGGKETKWFSEANHLKEIKDLLAGMKAELRKIIRDHGYFYRDYGV